MNCVYEVIYFITIFKDDRKKYIKTIKIDEIIIMVLVYSVGSTGR